ncbi:MAG: hypothetical protein E7427_02675 [Ruminococcaceae bacterium]|nr:hypothetical protein [Oscillospiraceae bacterium]
MTALALRLAGSAMLIAAGTMLGWGRLREMERRLTTLRCVCEGLGRMAAELETLAPPLRQVLSGVRDLPFFRLVAAGFGGERFQDLWQRAAETLPLSEAERRALAAPGAVLGRCDAATAAAELTLARRALSERADALERDIAARGRRFAGLGAALGAIAAAVLF